MNGCFVNCNLLHVHVNLDWLTLSFVCIDHSRLCQVPTREELLGLEYQGIPREFLASENWWQLIANVRKLFIIDLWVTARVYGSLLLLASLVPSLSNPKIFIAYSKNRYPQFFIFQAIKDLGLGRLGTRLVFGIKSLLMWHPDMVCMRISGVSTYMWQLGEVVGSLVSFAYGDYILSQHIYEIWSHPTFHMWRHCGCYNEFIYFLHFNGYPGFPPSYCTTSWGGGGGGGGENEASCVVLKEWSAIPEVKLPLQCCMYITQHSLLRVVGSLSSELTLDCRVLRLVSGAVRSYL